MRAYTLFLPTLIIFMSCQKDKECQCSSHMEYDSVNQQAVFIPNIFTPNGDGVNDKFLAYIPAVGNERIFYKIKDGDKIVFEDMSRVAVWDGKVNGSVPHGCKKFRYEFSGQYVNGVDFFFEGDIVLYNGTCPEETSNCVFPNQFVGNGFDLTIEPC